MTYAIGRPHWARFTGVRSRSGLIHIASGWNFLDGTRTRCGRTLRNDGDYFHLASATVTAIGETFETGTPCQRCLRDVVRSEDRI